MAKKKSDTRSRARKKPEKKSGGGLLHFLMLPFVRFLILVAAVVALIYWQWGNLVSWTNSIFYNTLRLFGWGLLIIAMALVTLTVLMRLRKLSSFVHHWHQWLGSIALTLAVWGTLAFLPGEGILRQVNLGGTFGLSIIGYPDFTGILRITGLAVAGIVLIAPKECFLLVAELFSRLRKKLKSRPAPSLAIPKKTMLAAITQPQEAPADRVPESPITKIARKGTPATSPTPTQAQPELRQVAQEVWKKYGEIPTLTIVDGWRLPPVDILDATPEVEYGQADNMKRARQIEEALASYGVDAKVVQINSGPTVTQFGVEPGWDRKLKEIREKDRDGNVRVKQEEISRIRVKVERITSLANDLALALAASSIRIEAPVPGKSIVGIEVPNTTSSVVSLRGVIETSVFQKAKTKTKLCIALGKGAGGEAVAADLAKMPHLLIAGATGSGKTVCLNTIICCLLVHNTPADVRFIMVDPKRVELTPFNSIPHLATPVIVDVNKALDALRWLNQEMDNRYKNLATVGVRNIEGYNKNRTGDEKLPYLVLIIDELADLMMAGYDEVEHILCRLAQLARAVGIHLVVATQRPSVDVVTGLIKANFPTRISFAVTSQVDSRTILDSGGAEKLLGKGDMLYMPTEAAKPKRLQGCFVSDPETERLVFFWGGQHQKEVASLKIEGFVPPTLSTKRSAGPQDPLLEKARQLMEEHEHISTSFLQRRLQIGYPRAARIMEQLQEESGEGEEEPV